MPKHPLRALFFDIDDTVYSTTEFAGSARQNAVRAMIRAGLQMDEDECLHELDEVISEFGSNYPNHFDKLIQRLPTEAIADTRPIIVVAAGMVAYHQTKFRNLSPYEDAIDVLKRLRERGVTLGIITSGIGIKQAEKIVRLGLNHIVPGRNIFITDTLGVAKTNPKIFLRACREVGVPPEEAVYVGDNAVVDVDVPHRIGMKTILNRRSGKYIAVEGKSRPDYIIHNFWDLLDVLEQHFDLPPEA